MGVKRPPMFKNDGEITIQVVNEDIQVPLDINLYEKGAKTGVKYGGIYIRIKQEPVENIGNERWNRYWNGTEAR